ncbi:MAG TPA: hypothetical protein VJS15_08670 [Allosphingosinicella sp.]|nr:hypothetical protein [Allosphingosinicella sp.]
MARAAFRLALALAASLPAATPALATSTVRCASPERGAPILYVSVGSSGGIDYAQIVEGRLEIATGIGRAHPRIGPHRVTATRMVLDIIAANADTFLARLDTRARGAGYVGTLAYRGRAWRIRCRWDEG